MAETNSGNIRQRKKPPIVPAEDTSQVNKSNQATPPQDPLELKTNIIFYLLFISHVLAAIYHPIQDCDEVFNYWEPTHYLTHGHGFQTWEYSPVYAIRSWAYAGLHALVTLHGKMLRLGRGSKIIEFYVLRIVLGFVCALCETRLTYKIASTLNPRIAIVYLVISTTSPGMFHASIAYLPSSFTMYTTMLGMAAFMDWRGGLRTAEGIIAMGTGAVLGWPFSAAMAAPFLIEEVILATISDKRSASKLFSRVANGVGLTLIVLAFQVGIDSFFYRKAVVVPFNIVWYNVFSGKGGPDLYGTEPWHFYFRNLALNFHAWFLLALLSMPLMLAQSSLRSVKGKTKATHWRGIVFLSPFYLWLAIFTLQPHKEERFMYPAYPALALNASVALFIILANFGSSDRRDMISKVPLQLRYTFSLLLFFGALVLSVLRILGTISAYNAPLSIYVPLHRTDVASPGDTVCLGKEWYRFPSHFLLPEGVRAKFIKSEFSGLLPGDFYESNIESGTGKFPGTWMEPPGMNDANREDPGKYTKLKNCNFMVDLQQPSTRMSDLEPNYMMDTEHWERVKCLPFMDSAATGILGKLIWIPNFSWIPQNYRRVYGDYCLLKRRKIQGSPKRDPIPHIETLG